MGCCASSDAEPLTAQSVRVEVKGGKEGGNRYSGGGGRSSAAGAPSGRVSGRSSPLDKWSLMESAEESGFLREEGEEGGSIDALLEREFPAISASRSRFGDAGTWKLLTSEVEVTEGDFELKPPWTLAQVQSAETLELSGRVESSLAARAHVPLRPPAL